MIQLAKDLIALDEAIKAYDQKLKELKDERDELSEQLVSAMTDEEVQNISVQGKVLYLNTRTYASPVANRREELFRVMEQNGYADIVKPTINANTLSATVRELMEQNDGMLPDWIGGYVNLHAETKIGIKKSGTHHI